ncbi:uncharacterized protein RCO7_03446 [Rhynchosporium graminicola]|uniref:CHRD domain-containing protein n=1 Tax=Rhynchosporium graminicola TaxID=2792576 RepID=A0A1E1LDY8_9HELO|nr:uncharacterized protein RCO7_03446 [Rhynchosporium commune]
MKFSTIASVAAILTAPVFSAPTDIKYGPPKGGWESVDYPKGTGENLPAYPAPPGGWENVKYPKGTGENLPSYPPGTGEGKKNEPEFTSTYHITALGAEVRNGTVSVPGPKDSVGYFNYGVNSKTDRICWEITLHNVAGTYVSPARTATHIHEASRGASGPPRLAFPNPVGDDKKRVSTGCMVGPFTTGLKGPNGQDTGIGFKLSQIEANPAGFFTDSHTNLFPLGVVRGQLA